jgi:hypothetical protein
VQIPEGRMQSDAATRWLGRLADVRRRYGARAVVRWVGYRLAQRVIDVNVAHVLWLDAANVNPSLRPEPAYTFRFLWSEEIRALAADPDNRLSPAMAERIAAGRSAPASYAGRDFCFAALAGRRLAAYGWFALGSIEPEHNGGTALSFPPDAAYMYNGFTRPEFRGKRLHGLVKGLGLRALNEHGVTKLVSTVDWTNGASLRSNFRLGCIDLGRAVVIRCGRFRAGFYPRAAKRLGIRFNKDAATSRAAAASGPSSGPGAASVPDPLRAEPSTRPSESPLAATTD